MPPLPDGLTPLESYVLDMGNLALFLGVFAAGIIIFLLAMIAVALWK